MEVKLIYLGVLIATISLMYVLIIVIEKISNLKKENVSSKKARCNFRNLMNEI